MFVEPMVRRIYCSKKVKKTTGKGTIELQVSQGRENCGTRYEEMARGYETSSRNTDRRDREYADAVEQGDTKKTEQMVKAAAKRCAGKTDLLLMLIQN